MSTHQLRRRTIPKCDFRTPFDIRALRRELSSTIQEHVLPPGEIDYADAERYIDRKAMRAVIVPRLRRILRASAHSFVKNHELIAEAPREWECLGARDAYEAAHIITVAEHAEPGMTDAVRRALYDGIDLGDHAVRINEPKLDSVQSDPARLQL